MSGASGKVLAAIHVTPEAAQGGALAKLRNGDVVRVDAEAGVLTVVAPEAWNQRADAVLNLERNDRGVGRELFSLFRANAVSAEAGGSVLGSFD
jgi:phosphogluconate dehydratase